MAINEHQLPQLTGKTCITDAGLETELYFLKQIDLPEFASYVLLKNEEGYGVLYDYYRSFAELARQYGLGLILETPTWRASRDWGTKLGDSEAELHELNVKAVKLIENIREGFATADSPIVISGNIGPRGDGYAPGNLMSTSEAKDYHSHQITSFSGTAIDLVTALTLNYVEEAIGITLAAKESGLAVCIAFTVETDGKLPTGDTLEQAIRQVDRATESYPLYYMINCAHPAHFGHLFEEKGEWQSRVKGLRANASCLSHAELDESETLDDGDPEAFGRELRSLRNSSPHINILGGCCGTDYRHIEQVCRNVSSA